MNKNLKKVISSVVALALSLGSLSAFAASGYSDVADTANYATAVNELSALGIVNGYTDGTFQPDNKVTRAEVTKMIVAALAQTAAADAAQGVTQFSDVAADHWASGFINVGSSTSGFINGMGDGTFAPESNVTYAQLVKMLVASLGYGGMALQEGGYPTGYITVGDRIGVTKSITKNANDELTRGDVAILIDNSLNLPLLVNTTWSAANPEYEIKDGKGKEFKSLLTEYHDTYKVEGKIVATKRTLDGLDPDEARFEVAVADRFDDDGWITRSEDGVYNLDDRTQTVKVADDIDATADLFNYSTALIHKNDDDEYELISLNTTAKSKSVDLAAAAFDYENTSYRSGDGDTAKEKAADVIVSNIADSSVKAVLKFYASEAKTGKVTEYKLDNEVSLYVNGVEVAPSRANFYDYLTSNKVGTVTLVDAPQTGKATTDGYYDYVLVDYYQSAVVSDVLSDGTVYFDTYEQGGLLNSSIEFDQDKVEDEDLTYTITLDGKKIDFKDLQADDVVSIAYDVTKSDIEDSSFYDVIVTRGTVEGKVTTEDTDDEYFVVGGTSYKYDEVKLPDGYSDTAVGEDVTLYLDAFGRIVKLEETASSKKYAILDNVYTKSGETDYTVRIVLPDTTTAEYTLKNESDATKLKEIAFVDGESGTRNPIEERVITYKVNGSGEIHTVVSQEGRAVSDEYVEKSNKIGSLKLNDNTAILDVSEYTTKISDIKKVTKLTDDTKYTAYGFDKLSSDSTYSFVIITDGIGSYNDDTQLAVFVKSYTDTNSDGDSQDAVTLLYDGKEQSFFYDASFDIDNLNKGDIITFQLNSSDEIDQVDVIAAMDLSDGTNRNPFEDRGSVVPNYLDKWNKAITDDTDVELMYGRIVDRSSSEITLVPVYDEDGDFISTTRSKDEVDYDIDSDTKIYVYSYKNNNKSALYVGQVGDIVKTVVPSVAKDKDDDDAITWPVDEYDTTLSGDSLSSFFWSTNYAFVKAVKDDATEIIVVIGPGKANY